MATDDQQVLVTGRAAAPASFRVPGNGQIQPKAVFASFDGTGAASAFLPALKIISDGGETVGIYPTDESVAAGGSAAVSWAPFLGRGAAANGGGGTVAGYVVRSATQTFGPAANHPALFNAGSLVTNDPATFSSPDNFSIDLAHGGLVRYDVACEFGTNGGVPYTGEFEVTVQLLDATNNPVDELTGPPLFFSELYATDQGDTFILSGTGTANADDTFYVPPYNAKMFFTVSVNVTFFNYAMLVAIENPTGLT